MSVQCVAIVTDDPGWHGKELAQALARRGLAHKYISLTDCQIKLSGQHEQDIILPGFNQALPIAIFVRGLPGGTLEQVVFRLNILHALAHQAIPIYNGSRAIERTVDKALTSLLLNRAGLPTPPTWICESYAQAMQIWHSVRAAGQRLVLKPMFGSQGIGLQRLEDDMELAHDTDCAGVYYLQQYVEPAGDASIDYRVFVIDGTACAAMQRTGASWINNRAQGATCHSVQMDSHMQTLAETAVEVLDMDYAGVDLIPDRTGKLQILEVNSIPAWYGLQQVTEINIAERLIDALLNRISYADDLASMV